MYNSTNTVPAFIKHNPPELQPPVSSIVWENAVTSLQAGKCARIASQNVKTRTASFKTFIHACSRKSKDDALTKFDISRLHKWEEVEAEAERAVKAYNTKGKKNPVRAVGKAMGNTAPAIKAWLDLLPDGEYTSIVCGALKLVFGVRVNPCQLRASDETIRLVVTLLRGR
ncbi:MAG: hypothetical protein M1827_006078 [Pycnora praestabilis]|nr:MAG: hypothetical protein M1827_006078 [Pycnora praestabilis]